MTELTIVASALRQFAGLTEEEFGSSALFWSCREFKKGEFYNQRNTVCKYLGFIIEGTFRSYVLHQKSGAEKNVFFYSQNKFLVTFKSFINQIPCEYYTQALTDAKVIFIHIDDLLKLYRGSHKWETFGRLLAQEGFNVVINRIEGFVFRTPEERYLELIKDHPAIFKSIPLYHISSYLGMQGPSLSRIRKRISEK